MTRSPGASFLSAKRRISRRVALLCVLLGVLLLTPHNVVLFSSTFLAVNAKSEQPVPAHEYTHAPRDIHVQSRYPVKGDRLPLKVEREHVGTRRDTTLAATCEGYHDFPSPPSQTTQARAAVSVSTYAGIHSHGSNSVKMPRNLVHTQRHHSCLDCPSQAIPIHQRHTTTAGSATAPTITPTYLTDDLEGLEQSSGAVVDAVTAYAAAMPISFFPDSLRLATRQESGTYAEEDDDDFVGENRTQHGILNTPRWSRRGTDLAGSKGNAHQHWPAHSSGDLCHRHVSVLLAPPENGGRRLALALQRTTVPAEAEQGATKYRRESELEGFAWSEGKVFMLTAQLEEQLRSRCLLTNSRNSEEAFLMASLDGRLHRDCVIVVADVGNVMPGYQGNTKNAVAIVTFLVLIVLSFFLCLL